MDGKRENMPFWRMAETLQRGIDMIKTVQYQNGNLLSYAEAGDPNGYPILIQHGLIASIRDHALFERLIETGARLINIARPGYGESSPYGMRNIGEWGKIVSVLVDTLGLAQFDVLGISSGAPYSYAIGYQFPKRARNLFILSGTPALYDEKVASFWPYPVNQDAGLAELQTLAYTLFFAHLSQEDLEKNEIQDSMRNACFGIAQDFQLRCRDWGFALSEVKGRVLMRHSKADESVPWITVEMTARLLPNCRLELRENGAHFSRVVLDDFICTVMAGYYH
jgi:pimeloyl-ACP methyl ester carboxylesterase